MTEPDTLEDYAVHCLREANRVALGPLAFAKPTQRCCPASHPLGFECTRPEGHRGDHVAHGVLNQIVQIWPANPDPIW